MRPQSLLIASITVIGLFLPAMAQQSIDKQNVDYELEVIYVAHSIRISNTTPPTAFCTNAPFEDGRIIEAYFTWSSVQISPNDGRLSNPTVNTIGDIRGCFGSTVDPSLLNV